MREILWNIWLIFAFIVETIWKIIVTIATWIMGFFI